MSTVDESLCSRIIPTWSIAIGFYWRWNVRFANDTPVSNRVNATCVSLTLWTIRQLSDFTGVNGTPLSHILGSYATTQSWQFPLDGQSPVRAPGVSHICDTPLITLFLSYCRALVRYYCHDHEWLMHSIRRLLQRLRDVLLTQLETKSARMNKFKSIHTILISSMIRHCNNFHAWLIDQKPSVVRLCLRRA